MTDPAVFDQVRDVAERSIAEARSLTGRALLEAAPTVRDLAYLLIKLDGIELARRRAEAKREPRPEPAADPAPRRRAGRPTAFTREQLRDALPQDGSWATRRETCDRMGCAQSTFVKLWTDYAATDERFETETRGKARVACVRYAPEAAR